MSDLMLVTAHNGVPMADSRVIAEVFGKRHYNVISDIRELIAKDPAWAAPEFSVAYDFNQLSNKQVPYYLLTRDAATMLIMGFTGSKAFVWKRRYVEAFNAMEAQLKAGPVAMLSDMDIMKRAHLIASGQIQELTATVKRLEPVAQVERDIAASECDYLTLREAAKAACMKEREFLTYLHENAWLTSTGRAKNFRNQAKQCHVNAGYMRNKEVLYFADGEERFRNQAMFTKKGIARIRALRNA